jgi:hypothetical protein
MKILYKPPSPILLSVFPFFLASNSTRNAKRLKHHMPFGIHPSRHVLRKTQRLHRTHAFFKHASSFVHHWTASPTIKINFVCLDLGFCLPHVITKKTTSKSLSDSTSLVSSFLTSSEINATLPYQYLHHYSTLQCCSCRFFLQQHCQPNMVSSAVLTITFRSGLPYRYQQIDPETEPTRAQETKPYDCLGVGCPGAFGDRRSTRSITQSVYTSLLVNATFAYGMPSKLSVQSTSSIHPLFFFGLSDSS